MERTLILCFILSYLHSVSTVLDCKYTTSGQEYRGTLNVTETGKVCQRWDSQSPHVHNRGWMFEGPASPHENYCRNPDDDTRGPWCYTVNPSTRYEFCNVSLCQDSFISDKTMTWNDAHEFCNMNSSHLIINASGVDIGISFWTGNLYRKSDWIHILGCYEEESFNCVPIKFQLEWENVGSCQEYCRWQNYSYFAIKMKICACFTESTVVQAKRLTSSNCMHTCSDSDGSVINDCGGSNAYNVYRWTSSEFVDSLNGGDCLNIECNGMVHSISTRYCRQSLQRVCESEDASTYSTNDVLFFKWNVSSKKCKQKDEYLNGNLSIIDKAASCKKVSSIIDSTAPKWIGIARADYKTTNRGQFINKQSITRAETCSSGICSFSNFDPSMMNVALCRKNGNTQGMTSSAQEISACTTSVTQTITTIHANIDITKVYHTEGNSDHQIPTAVILSVSVVSMVIVVVFVILVVILVVRKRNSRQHHKVLIVNKQNNILTTNPTYANTIEVNQVNANGTNSIISETDINSTKGNPYVESNEGTYDHLRDVHNRQITQEDTYHHAEFIHVEDKSDYDISGPVNRNDSIYDHAHSNKGFHESEYANTAFANDI